MHVGEKGMWEKYTLWEETTRCPLLIADPRYPAHHSTHYWGIVELLDIIPTLLDLLNITRIPVLCPSGRLCPDFEGKSLSNVIRNGPSAKVEGIDFAISQLRRCPYLRNESPQSDHPEDKWNAICNRRNKEKGSVMGYSLRSDKFRYNAWFPYNQKTMRPELSLNLVHEELYSHENATVADIDIELENLILCELDICVVAPTYSEIRDDLKKTLFDFLKNGMNYNMKEARNRTIAKYSDRYIIKGDKAVALRTSSTNR